MAEDSRTPISIASASAMSEEQRERYARWKETVEGEQEARLKRREEALLADPLLSALCDAKNMGDGLEYTTRAAIKENIIERTEELERLLATLRKELEGRDVEAIRAAILALNAYIDQNYEPPDPPPAAQMALPRPKSGE